MKKRRFVIVALTILIITGLISGLWLFRPKTGLLDHAERLIFNIPEWTNRYQGLTSNIPYYWISEDDALFLRQVTKSETKFYRRKITPDGIDHPFELIENLSWRYGFNSGKISPDGQWLYGFEYFGWTRNAGHVVKGCYAMSLKTGKKVKVSSKDHQNHMCLWSADSKVLAWVERMGRQVSLVQKNVETGAEFRHGLAAYQNPQNSYDGYYDLQWLSEGKMIVVKNSSSFSHELYAIYTDPKMRGANLSAWSLIGERLFQEIDLKSPGKPPKEWKIPIPNDSAIGGLVVSPKGDRILWIVKKRLSTPWEELLHKIHSQYRPKIRYSENWSVSKLDGSEKREYVRYEYDGYPKMSPT